MRVVIAEKISASAVELLREPRWTVVTPEEVGANLPAQLENADALIVRSAVQVDSTLLEHAKKLRVIGRAGVGVDNVDLDAATRKGIAVMNTPGANAVAVAELTLGVMLAMARQISRADSLMHAGKWEKKSLQGTELRSKTLGVVGLGKIGMEVARRAKSFGMEIVAHDPFVSAAFAKEQGIRMGTLEEVFAAADYLTLHVGLTPQTFGMINSESIRTMKKGARLVNCARGELVKESDLAQALKAGTSGRGGARCVHRRTLEEFSPRGAGQCHSHPSRRRLDAGSSRSCGLPDCAPGEGVSEARCFSECGERPVRFARRIRGDAAIHRARRAFGFVSLPGK